MPFPLVAVLITAAVFVAGQLLQPAPPFENAKKKSLADFDRPTASTSRAIPVIFGRVKYAGPNLLWWGDYQTHPKTKKIRVSLFKSKKVITGWRYYLGMCLGLSWGKVDELTKIWADDKVAWEGTAVGGDRFLVNAPTLFGGEDDEGNAGEGGLYAWCKFYDGNGTQTPDSYLAARLSDRAPAGKVPARKRRSYLVWEGPSGESTVSLTGNGPFGLKTPVVTLSGYLGITGRVPQMAFELARWPSQLDSAHKKIGLHDANPIHCIYEILSADYYGGGLASGLIDPVTFLAAATQVYNEGLGVSFIWDGSDIIENKVIELLKVVDGTLFPDWQTGQLKIALARDDYDINDLMELGDGNGIVELSNFTRVVQQATNQLTVMYTNRSRDYQVDSSTPAVDIASARQVGVKPGNPLDYSMVTNPVVAQQLGERELRLLCTPLGRGTAVCDRRASRLRPGDVFKLSWTPLGITQMVVRVTRVRYGKLKQGKIELDFVQDVFKLAGSIYAQTGTSLWTNPIQNPQPITQARVEEWPYLLASQAAEAQLDPELPMILAVAGKPSPGDLDYSTYVSTDAGSTYLEKDTQTDFAPIGTLLNNLPAFIGGDVTATVDMTVNAIANLTVATVAEIFGGFNVLISARGEWMAYESFTVSGSTLTFNNVWRGVYDTTPKDHLAGDKIYFARYGESLPEDVYTNGQALKVKLLTRNGRGELTLASGTAIDYTIVSRALKPMPVAGLLINGDYDQVIYTGTPDWALTWNERNRLTQDGVIQQLDATVSPEASVTYEVRIYDWDGVAETLIKTVTGLTSPSYTYLHADEIVDNGRGERSPALIFKLRSVRSGNNSYQDYVRTVTTEPGYGSSGYGVSYGE